MSHLKVIRYGAWAAVAALVIVAGYLVTSQFLKIGSQSDGFSMSAIGGPFELVNGKGEKVTQADITGKPSLVFFGFTFCPEVCPTTLSDMQGWMADLGADADKLNYVFITVDPERDTPEVMDDYVSVFSDKIMALTGTREEIDSVIKKYRVYAKKVPLDDGDYTMDHTATVYLMDAENKFAGTIAYGEAEKSAVKKLRRLIDGSSSATGSQTAS